MLILTVIEKFQRRVRTMVLDISKSNILNFWCYSEDKNDGTIMFDALSYEKLKKNLEYIDSSIGYTNEGKTEVVDKVSNSIELLRKLNMIITDDRPLHLYFNRKITANDFQNTLTCKDDPELARRRIFCSSWCELPDVLKLKPKTIAINEVELEYGSALEIVNMIKTLSKLVDIDYTIPVAVAISKDTKITTIKDLQKSSIHGIVPEHTSFGWDETIKGLNALWANIPYWPKHILEQLPGNKQKKVTSGEIKLTARQQQILNLIKERGASNKVIARTLNITESTVKLHVGIVLKKFNVKNRTQLALFS